MIMRRILWTIFVSLLALIAFYMSRFWFPRWWGREGLFGQDALVPQGGLVGRWLRGTDLSPFELLIWVIGVFLVFTVVQKIFDLLGTIRFPD